MTARERPIEALLLAAGRGERLRPLTDEVPKPAIPMPGAPLGAWMLETLLKAFDAVAVNVSHLPHDVISKLQLEGRAEVLPEDPEPFGTAGTLVAIRDRVAEHLVVANSDLVADVDVASVLDDHRASGSDATVVVRRVQNGADFELDDRGRISAFVDRRTRPTAPGAVFLGISVFERAVLEELPEARPLGMGASLLAPLVRAGRLSALVHEGYARDVGTLGRYVDTCGDILRGVAPPPPPGPYEELSGTTIEVDGGRAWVADTAECREATLGPGAVILNNARVAAGASLARAVVWPREIVPAGAIERAVWFRGSPLAASGEPVGS